MCMLLIANSISIVTFLKSNIMSIVLCGIMVIIQVMIQPPVSSSGLLLFYLNIQTRMMLRRLAMRMTLVHPHIRQVVVGFLHAAYLEFGMLSYRSLLEGVGRAFLIIIQNCNLSFMGICCCEGLC